jgi:hypothetical protein
LLPVSIPRLLIFTIDDAKSAEKRYEIVSASVFVSLFSFLFSLYCLEFLLKITQIGLFHLGTIFWPFFSFLISNLRFYSYKLELAKIEISCLCKCQLKFFIGSWCSTDIRTLMNDFETYKNLAPGNFSYKFTHFHSNMFNFLFCKIWWKVISSNR